MELKPYQQAVLNDLQSYLSYLQKDRHITHAFNHYWEERVGPYRPLEGLGMEQYKDTITGVPHVSMKVPTAGGKTFIACNALKVLFDNFDTEKTKLVLWLVPSITILNQTVQNLKNPSHPYRQKLNVLFQNKVQVFQKEELLQGAGFNPSSVREHVSILVLSFDSLRSRSKDTRKMYQENGQLASFTTLFDTDDHILEGTDETAFINIVRKLNPVVVVDESHNAESELSVDMLKNLNPCFILDLTATPKKNSNIVSFVDALELKKENMVKLPVIVYNHRQKEDVIASSIHLRNKLEEFAKQEFLDTGKYIRPIVLFQAEVKSKGDSTTFEKIKKILIDLKIPEEQIKIKTAEIDEIKGLDLMSSDCDVRYIITINALKEGWDCPFAYILATLADRSSSVDVEQILGRILRQPYVMQHRAELLNMSYVLTSSSVFNETLGNIVKGLNRAGFSDHDYKVSETPLSPSIDMEFMPRMSGVSITSEPKVQYEIPFDKSTVEKQLEDTVFSTDFLQNLTSTAMQSSQELKQSIAEQIQETEQGTYTPHEIAMKTKFYAMKDAFSEGAQNIVLPQFHYKLPTGGTIFGEEEQDTLVSKEMLLEGFPLSTLDSTITFDQVSSELYKVDLERQRGEESTPTFLRIEDDRLRKPLIQYLRSLPPESQKRQLTGRIVELLGKMHPISNAEISKYVTRIVDSLTPEQYDDFLMREYSYVNQIKKKIEELARVYREKMFDKYLDLDKAYLKPSFRLPKKISPTEFAPSLAKSLYEKEGTINGFEVRVIEAIANLDTILWWHRNEENKGFFLNGFINHYPDFIVMTKKGKILVLETKGDDRDNTDSAQKVKLGQLWTSKARQNFKYMMIFDHTRMEGAYTFEDAISLIKEL